MIYAGGSSSASSAKVPYALTTYFGYDCGMSYLQKVLFSDEEWAQMIRTELDAQRPVLYSGQTLNNEGHAFICDGYDNAGYYHMNWGWQGMANGYYLIVGTDALNADVSSTGGGTVGLGYTEGNDMIIGIQKAQAGSSYNYFMYCNQPFTVNRSNITANTLINLKGGFFNGSIVEAEFEVGMRFKHTAADYSADINCTSSTLKTNSGFSSYGRNPSALRYNGKYEVYPIYRVKGSSEWKVMQYNKSWAVPTTIFSGGEEPPVVNPPVPEKKYYNVSVTSSSAEKGTVTVEGVADGKAEEGSDITITAVPREGYEFVKWSDGNNVNPRTINVKDNITLTAQFSAKQYNIIYKVDGSDYKTVTVEYGSEVTPIAAPEKEGYTFSGWKGLPESTMPAHDVTVNGTFSVNSYTLTYIYNNETVKEIMLEYGSEIPDFNYVPENPNHTFVGWRTEGYTTMPAYNLTFIADFVDGIGTITALPQDVKIFDASGKRIMKLQKGLNILVYPDGKAIKVRR